ncbi:MAG: DegV family protein [Ruminococcus sp.]|nr:DegV family protein [Ruminococcus sp.]
MVRIYSDSTCDLSKELCERYNITILPLYIILGDKDYRDGENITPTEIFKWSDEHKTTPKTSAASLEDIAARMKPALDAGDDIVAFSISAEMSNMGNVIRLAAQSLDAEDRVHYIDSRNLSTGIGHLVVEAAELAQKGTPAEEIVEYVTALIPKVRASFVVDTLTYLHRGGRCSGLAAMAGSVLRLHPKISVKDGVMGAGKKYRGKYSSIIVDYAKEMKAELLKAKPDRVFVTHTVPDSSREPVEQVLSYLRSLGYFKEVLETKAGGVVSSHCGPGTLGVLYIEGEE